MTKVKIDNLNIRFKGPTPERSRSAIAGVGGNLIHRLADSRIFSHRSGFVEIGAIDAGSLTTRPDLDHRELQTVISRKLAGAIARKATGRGGI